MNDVAVPTPFMRAIREWRQARKLSQLDLALEANISQRHVSYLENGRSQPSRDMVIRLCEAMDIPLRERNLLLQSAGFAAHYRETGLEDPAMEPIMEALNNMLSYHDPFPAIVVDRMWNVVKLNEAAQRLTDFLFSLSPQSKALMEASPLNLAMLTLHPAGLRQYMTNWDELAPSFISRLKQEASACASEEQRQQIAGMLALVGHTEVPISEPSLYPVVPLKLDIQGQKLNLFTVISTFGTPQDITTDELRIELFYPNDPQTDAFFRQAAQ